MIPIRIKPEEQYILSYSIEDVKILEIRHGSLLLLWNPQNFGYLTSAILIHAGAHLGGKHVYAQDSVGLSHCYSDVKEFVAGYRSAFEAFAYLYGTVKLALCEDGWIPDEDAPAVTEPAKKEVVKELPKSRTFQRFQTLLSQALKSMHMVPAGSPQPSSRPVPLLKSRPRPKPSTDTTSAVS